MQFWDIPGSKADMQSISAHREKAREGMLVAESHQSLPFVASAGVDGIINSAHRRGLLVRVSRVVRVASIGLIPGTESPGFCGFCFFLV